MSKEFDYEKWVEECYTKSLNQEIHNASEKNALLLFERLFDKAIRDKQDVKIISNKLLARFYNQLVGRFEKITKNGNMIQVIVEQEIDDKNNNNFYQCSKNSIKIASNFEGLPNFIVVGDNAYRYETDKNNTKAIANFNDKSMGVFIVDLFDKINNDIVAV
ncbi:hypothetical protein SPONN_1527 [uncultured Candidatus Thioglobus sp.]|nr:hypothetical protein SPONN_1527 [uncultured Candidatus Thioglobus sp.]